MINQITLTTTIREIILPSNHRKSWFIQNIGSETVWIYEHEGGQYIELPTSGSISQKIPEDNPNLEVYARTSTSSGSIRIWEQYSKKGQ